MEGETAGAESLEEEGAGDVLAPAVTDCQIEVGRRRTGRLVERILSSQVLSPLP